MQTCFKYSSFKLGERSRACLRCCVRSCAKSLDERFRSRVKLGEKLEEGLSRRLHKRLGERFVEIMYKKLCEMLDADMLQVYFRQAPSSIQES